MEKYSDPVLAKYIDTIKGIMGDRFKAYYQGNPDAIPKMHRPAFVIYRNRTEVSAFTNDEDQYAQYLTIHVVVDSRDTVNNDPTIVAGPDMLIELVEGRNADYTLKQESVLGIIRSLAFMDPTGIRTDLGSVTNVDYGISVNERGQGETVHEAVIQFIAHFIQSRTFP